MPNIPANSTLAATSADILNAIRNNASVNYQNYVPAADNNPNSLREIGNIIMDNAQFQNEFLSALVNRIGLTLITSKSYDNPWKFFKRGLMAFGETVEEIFVNIATVEQFDPEVAETDVFRRRIPDVRAAFHYLNYQKFYPVTVSREQLAQAFLSYDGVANLIGKIIESLYTAMNYDEFLVMKYLIARNILNGRLSVVNVANYASATDASERAAAIRGITSAIKGRSDSYTFMSQGYNAAGVYTHSEKERQFVILNTAFNAEMDVEVLAASFHMDRATFAGHTVLVDGFGEMDTNRLNKLFADDENYTPLTDAEKTALNLIPAVLVDENWFMIFDNLLQMREQDNAQGLYWNYFLHAWKTFSTSPFANATVFVPGTSSVTKVTVTPSTATAAKGSTVALSVDVETTGFAPQTVTWTLSSTNDTTLAYASINNKGVVTIDSGATSGHKYTATATSTANSSKTATSTITVA